MEIGEVPIQSNEQTKPPRLPTTWEFRAKLWRFKDDSEQPRPPVPDNPTASDLARYGRVDLEHIYGKGKIRTGKNGEQLSLPSYLHGLARLMMTREGYLGTTEDGQLVDPHTTSLHVGDTSATQHITIMDDWSIGWEGNHRLLILKLLGPEFVKRNGMDQWVKVGKI